MHHYPLSVLIVSWVFWLWETYLDYRQYRVYKSTQKVPKELEDQIDAETFSKAKAYAIDKARFGFISSVYSQVQSTVMIYYFLLPYFWDISRNLMTSKFGFTRSDSIEWEIFQSLMFTFITSLASALFNIPFSIYNTFVIEQRHGFNKQTAGFYARDKLKTFSISFLISAPIVIATIYIVRNGGSFFFLYLWMFCFVVICLLTFFHGEIAALFDKFTPLQAGELRDKIEELSNSLNFPLTNIFIVEGSKRSAHSNAYQSGILNKKRIVIYDTLIESFSDVKKSVEEKETLKTDEKESKRRVFGNEEILAILCHELGHWHCGHLFKNLAFIEVNYFLMFLIFSKFYDDPSFYAAFGFVGERPVIIGLVLLMMVLTPYSQLNGFIAITMSRYFEHQADEFAVKQGRAEQLKTALVKLSKENLGFPVHDKLYSMFNHSHPTLIERLKALDKKSK